MIKLIFSLATAICLSSFSFADTAQFVDSYGKTPLAFTVNRGQTDSDVRFTASGSGCSMFFTPSGTAFVLSKETPESSAKNAAKKPALKFAAMDTDNSGGREYESFAVKTLFVGANSTPEMVGEERLPYNNNYFKGNNPAEWQTDVPNYSKVRLLNVYNGIDLVYYGNKSRMKYDFVVKSGEEPSKIAVKYDLGENAGGSLSLNAKGQLLVNTPLGDLIEEKPYCYQIIDEAKTKVEVSYKIIDSGENIFGFEIGEYDEGYDLIIDPEIAYSTFLGGAKIEYVYGISVDSSGNTYISGSTTSTDYPATSGAYTTGLRGYYAAFVSKLNSSGTNLEYSTYICSSVGVDCYGIALDSQGCAYITGYTFDSDYPTTDGAYNTVSNGERDAFITKLSPTGNNLEYSTYIGGSGYDFGDAITVDDSGNAYITGYTTSSDYPAPGSSFDSTYHGGTFDAFVTKLNPTGSDIIYSTYLGGENNDSGYGISVDSEGNAYVTGVTGSSDFPVTSGAFDLTYHGGTFDVFVTKLNPTGSALVYSTYLGGDGVEYGYGIDFDKEGNAYVTGETYSDNYPVTDGAFDSTRGTQDAFVTKLNPTGSALVYSTFLGGSSWDFGTGIRIDSSGNTYISGSTNSYNFPVTNDAFDSTKGAGYSNDVFVTKLNPTGSNLIYSTDLGGDGDDLGYGLAIDSYGSAYISGYTSSSDFYVTDGAYDTSYNGGDSDAFIAKFTFSSDSVLVSDNIRIPKSFSLSQNLPNPFNPATTIGFSLTNNSKVVLKIYNLAGQEVATLKDEQMSAGKHSVIWNAERMSSGVYFYTLKANGITETRKMTLVK